MRCQGLVRWAGACVVLICGITGTEAAYNVELVTGGLSRPVFVCSPPGDSNRLFIIEQRPGRIRIIDRAPGTLRSSAFLTITGLATGNEQGLLGLAFHPGYRTNGYFYINNTPSGGIARTEINRYTVQGDPATSNVADPASKKLILSFNQPESNHNGGWMAFGPDGYLYISTGDGGGGDDVHGSYGNGQNRSVLLGKILRIDVDGGDPYAIPDGNPFKGDASFAPEIWAFGLRNPWRCSFDRATGDLWIGDVGQNTREEVDVIPAGAGGLNFGWRPREGAIQNPAYPNEQPVSLAVSPVTDYPRSLGFSITGGYLYRGSAIPELQGKYIFADYGSARFWAITPDASGTNGTRAEITSQVDPSPRKVNQISSFGEDAAGELYVCDLDGEVYKIVPEGPAAASISAVEATGENQFIIRFNALAGQSYTLESKTTLGNGLTWTNEQVIAAGTVDRTLSITNSLTGAERYFRLRSE